MRVFLIDKFLIRHIAFLYLEIKSSIFLKLPIKGKFKIFKRLYVRFLINYIESVKYYLSKKKIDTKDNLIDNKNLKLEEHGIEFLKKVDINKFDFLNYNLERKINSATTINKINFHKAKIFAKKNDFHKLAKNYLKVDRCNFFVASHNTYAYERDEEVETNFWHKDRDGVKLVKIFIYLSDVSHESGPHFFILGSHKKKPLRFVPQFRYEDKVIKKYFNNNNIFEICGDKGTCFIEDTSGFHRGSKPINNNIRSILSFTYFTGPVYYDEDCGEIDLQ